MPDPTTHSRSREARIQRIGDGPYFAEVDKPKSLPGLGVGAAVVAAGLLLSGTVLFPGTDQTGIYVPDHESPHLTKQDFGVSLTPNLGGTLATLALLKGKFPDFAKNTFPDFATHALPTVTELVDLVKPDLPDVPMAEIQPVPQQVVPGTSTPEILPPNFTEVEPLYAPSPGGGGGLAPTPQTPPAPNLQIPPEPKLNLPELAGIPQLPDIPKLPDIPQLPVPRFSGTARLDPTHEESAEKTQTGSAGTSQTGSTGTSNGATSQGRSGDSSNKSGDGSKKSDHGPKGSDDGSKGSDHGSKGSGRSGGDE